jgi:hypothetical protein
MIKANSELSEEALRRAEEIDRIGNRGVQAAQEENRRRGIPNVYSINGILYWELPDGTLSKTDPYKDSDNSRQS